MEGKRQPISTAEQAIKKNTAAIVKRIANGATITAAFGMSGYTKPQTRMIISIAQGREPEVTDKGYRKACESLHQKIVVAIAKQEHDLAKHWRKLAVEGDDWRSIAELLKRRNPEEWAVTERSEVSFDGDVNVRAEDAVLKALAALRGEATGDAA